MKLEKLKISDFLPHKEPFLMVGEILSIDSESIISSFQISDKCIFLEDNVLSEAGLIENAAQTCSAIVGQSFFDQEDTKGESKKLVGFISAIKKVDIFNLPQVNQKVLSKAYLKSRLDLENYSICTMVCEISFGELLLLKAEMNLFIKELK